MLTITLQTFSDNLNRVHLRPVAGSTWDQLNHIDYLTFSLGHLGPLGAQYRAPLVKSEFFFFCVFSRYLCDGESSVDPTLILQCRAPGLFIAQSVFREMFSALPKSGLLRHVTSRFVTVNLFSNKRTPNGYYVPPWVNFLRMDRNAS